MKTHKIHTGEHKQIYAQWNGPSVTKRNPQNCKNCSSKCAYDCAQLQYTIQHSSSDNLPSYLQTNIIAQMLSSGGEGDSAAIEHYCPLARWIILPGASGQRKTYPQVITWTGWLKGRTRSQTDDLLICVTSLWPSHTVLAELLVTSTLYQSNVIVRVALSK